MLGLCFFINRVLQLRAVAVTGVPSANSGHCSAIPDVVAALWERATRDETCSAQLPLLFCQLRLSGLHLTTRMAPDPPPAREGVRCRHVPREEGCPTLAAGGLDLPLEGSGTSTSLPDLLSAYASAPSRGSGTTARPATAGAHKTLTCRARGTPPRHIWRTVYPTATTTPPAGVGRTPA